MNDNMTRQLESLIRDQAIIQTDADEFLRSFERLTNAEREQLATLLMQTPSLTPLILANTIRKQRAARLTQGDWIRAVKQEMAHLDAIPASVKASGILLAPEAVARVRQTYIDNPPLAAPAAAMLEESERLLLAGFASAAHVYAASASELMLKHVLMRPIITSSIGFTDAELADLIGEAAFGQTGFVRYQPLLAALFKAVTKTELMSVSRLHDSGPLIREALAVQARRNRILHGGHFVEASEAAEALAVAVAVFRLVVCQVMLGFQLQFVNRGRQLVQANLGPITSVA